MQNLITGYGKIFYEFFISFVIYKYLFRFRDLSTSFIGINDGRHFYVNPIQD